MRTSAPMQPKLILTANPESDCYLRKWLDDAGYLDDQGYPRKDMDGVRTWFIRIGNDMVWARTRQELLDKYGENCGPMSFVFLPATCHDNPVLLERDKTYLHKLQSLPRIERARLLEGNWHVRESASGYFKKEWVSAVNYHEQEFVQFVRSWDLAGTIPSEKNPRVDSTAGVLLGKTKDGRYVILDCVIFQARYGEVMRRIVEVARQDPPGTKVTIPRDPAQAGKVAAGEQLKYLHSEGVTNVSIMTTGNKSKVTRFQPFAVAAENGLVDYCFGKWNDQLFDQLEAFDASRNCSDDALDAISDGYACLATTKPLPKLGLGMNTTSFTKSSSLPF